MIYTDYCTLFFSPENTVKNLLKNVTSNGKQRLHANLLKTTKSSNFKTSNSETSKLCARFFFQTVQNSRVNII